MSFAEMLEGYIRTLMQEFNENMERNNLDNHNKLYNARFEFAVLSRWDIPKHRISPQHWCFHQKPWLLNKTVLSLVQ